MRKKDLIEYSVERSGREEKRECETRVEAMLSVFGEPCPDQFAS